MKIEALNSTIVSIGAKYVPVFMCTLCVGFRLVKFWGFSWKNKAKLQGI